MTYSFYMVAEYYWNGKYASLCEASTLDWGGGHVEMANAAIYVRCTLFKPSSAQPASTWLRTLSDRRWISVNTEVAVLLLTDLWPPHGWKQCPQLFCRAEICFCVLYHYHHGLWLTVACNKHHGFSYVPTINNDVNWITTVLLMRALAVLIVYFCKLQIC